jgi:16S rRNA processing protein RimM
MSEKSLSNAQNNLNAGSPGEGGPVFLVVGQLRRPHGVQGDIIMEVITDFPQRIRVGKTVYLGDKHEARQVARSRKHGQELILRLVGAEKREDVEDLTGLMVYCRADQLPALPEGQYYHHELLGIKVLDKNDVVLGVLNQILETGANDVYEIVSPQGEEILLPAIESVIINVDLEKKEMRVNPPEWW